MTVDLPTPCRPVRFLALSQSSTFHVSLARVFPFYFGSSYLPLSSYIRPQHFHQNVFFIDVSTSHARTRSIVAVWELSIIIMYSCVRSWSCLCTSDVAPLSHSPESVFLVYSLQPTCLSNIALLTWSQFRRHSPFSFAGIQLSHSASHFCQFIQPAPTPTRFVITVSTPPYFSSSLCV